MNFSLIDPKASARWSVAALVLALQACGGGGGGAEPSAPAASPNSAAGVGVAAAPAPAAIAMPPTVAQTPAPTPSQLSVSGPATAPPTPSVVSSAPAPAVASAPASAPAPALTVTSSSLVQLDGSTTCNIPGFRDAILKKINLARASGYVCGTQILPAVPPLAWNDILFSASARHSADMATRNYFSHTTPEGIEFPQRLWIEGYGASAGGENIAAGMGSIDGVMLTWMASEGHCRNIMAPIYQDVGVACAMQSGSTYGSYWTMDLGLR